jgi:hypothetical protein
MKLKSATVLLILALVLPLFLNFSFPTKASASSPSLYVGVDVAYESISTTEQLIDKVSLYTNVIVLGCTGYYDLTRLTTLAQYAYDKGLSFMVYSDTSRYPSRQWLANANTSWGDKFMGIYWLDEEGGRQLDQQKYPAFSRADNYSDAANKYNSTLSSWIRGRHSIANNFPNQSSYKLFTSDYAFYWYDYQLGYDAVFAEFGANYSRQINVALCRGAAAAMDKDWGVMITWTYYQPPYIESGSELYGDMVLAYQNGAKYILVFDSNRDYSQSILKQEHFDAMQQFWRYVQENPRTISKISDRTAYVLPQYYAYGFRGPADRIWGLWGPDSITSTICMNVSNLLQTYGTNIDIIYPDGNKTIDSMGYQNVYYASDPTQNISPSSDPKLPEIYIFTAAIASAAIVAGALFAFKFGRNKSEKPTSKLL